MWPYVVTTAAVAAIVSAFLSYHWLTAPSPPGSDDEGSSMGIFFAKIILAGFVVVCTFIGASLGWLIGYLVRVYYPVSDEKRIA